MSHLLELSPDEIVRVDRSWGLVHVDSWFAYFRIGLNIRVLYNGHDITERCVAADDRHGWVCILRKRDGHFYPDYVKGGIAAALLTGQVQYLIRRNGDTHG